MPFKTNGQIFNVVCTSKDTEYALDLPPGTVMFYVQARANDVRMAHQAGRVASAANGTYITVKATSPPRQVSGLTGPRTLYFAGTVDGAVVEVEAWI